MSIKSLSLKDQINHVLGCLQNAKIPPKSDRYLTDYPSLLEGIQGYAQTPTPQSIFSAGKLVYTWMRRRGDGFTAINMKPICTLVVKAQTAQQLSVDEIQQIADALHCKPNKNETSPINKKGLLMGSSPVAASKLLHFVAPDKYPIFDNKIMSKHWGGTMTAQNYFNFVAACRNWVGDKNIQVACKKFQAALAQAGHDVADLKTMRLVELALFLNT